MTTLDRIFQINVKAYLETLKWVILPHPPYSPDIAPSDYHLFWSMTHSLLEQRFTSYEDTKKWIDLWIFNKDKSFFQRGIRMLPEKLEKVVAADGQYIDEKIVLYNKSFLHNQVFFLKVKYEEIN